MRPRRLFWIAAIASVLAVVARRRGRAFTPAPARPRQAASLPLAIFAALYGWLIHADIFDDVGNFFEGLGDSIAGIADAVWNAIRSRVVAIGKGLVRAAESVFDFWIGVLGDALNVLRDVVTWGLNALGDAISWVWNAAQAALGAVASFLGGIINDVLNFAEGLAADLFHWIGQLLSMIADAIVSAVTWAWHNIYEPLLGFIHDVLNWVATAFLDLIMTIIDEVVSVLSAALDFLSGLVSDALRWIVDIGSVIWKIVQEAWSWLVWFATHTIPDLVHLIESLFQKSGPALVDMFTSALGDAGDSIDSFLSDLFG